MLLSRSCSCWPLPAAAGLRSFQIIIRLGTWSIVAVDADAAEVGVALATCVADDFRLSQSTAGGSGNDAGRMMYQVYIDTFLVGSLELARLLPGHGAIVAQATVDQWNSERIDNAASHLVAGDSAQDVIAAATSGDSDFQTRQYGVATLARGEDNFTGTKNETGPAEPAAHRFPPREIFWWDRQWSAHRWKRFKKS